MYEKLAFGICWYNDPGIIRTLESLPTQATKVVVDGRFKMSDAPTPLSKYSLRKLVKRVPNTVILDAPDLLEPDKRNVYLDYMTDYDYCFTIDSDEYIIKADWDVFYVRCLTLTEGLHYILMDSPKRGGNAAFVRLIVHPSEWKHDRFHAVWTNKKTGQTIRAGQVTGGTFKSVMMKEDETLRDKEWIETTDKYQKKLWAYEDELRGKVTQ